MSLMKLHFQPKKWVKLSLDHSQLDFEIIYCLLTCMFRTTFDRHDLSHFKDHCRYCCILKPADQDRHVRPFLETGCTLLSCQTGCDSFVLTPVCLHLLYAKCICVYSMGACVYGWLCVFCHCRCVSGCAPWRTVFWAQVDIRLTDIGGDSSTVAYGNRLLTAKTWHQRKQVSQAWHSVLLRGLRDRLSAYSGIITPITGTIIPDKGDQIHRLWWNQWQATKRKLWISYKRSKHVLYGFIEVHILISAFCSINKAEK